MSNSPIRVGLATTGGDAPGMNACIRAIVKGAPAGVDVVGIRRGALGLLRDRRGDEYLSDFFLLRGDDVAGILNRSGTILKSSREAQFREHVAARSGLEQGRSSGDLTLDPDLGAVIGSMAVSAVDRNDLDGLILIGGDKTSRAATLIYRAAGSELPVVVVPATIDNDIDGTVQTIGFDSAVAMAVSQVDAIRETALAMDRIFVVEVMGAEQGHVAAEVALATGAEVAIVPEIALRRSEFNEISADLIDRVRSGSSALVIVAEGAEVPLGDAVTGMSRTPAERLAAMFEAEGSDIEVRVAILGHTLRGAPPTATTRNLATRFGIRAIDSVVRQARGKTSPPRLLGMHHEGVLVEHEITGDMVRRDSLAVQSIVSSQIERLAYQGTSQSH